MFLYQSFIIDFLKLIRKNHEKFGCCDLCLSVTKVVIVNYGKMVGIFFFYKKESACMVLRILNLKRYKNCTISLKVKTILRKKNCPGLLRVMGESAGEGLWLLLLVPGRRLHVTSDTSHGKCVMSHVTCDSWHLKKSARKVTKSVKTKQQQKC